MKILGVEGDYLKVEFPFGDKTITYIPPSLDYDGRRYWMHSWPDKDGVAKYIWENDPKRRA